MTHHLRTEWQDPTQVVVGPKLPWHTIDTVAVHYTAAAKIPKDVPRLLRATQDDYTRNRGYSIGYNVAVDQTGDSWELRGFDIKCAANVDHNDHCVALLVLVDGADPLNEAMLSTARSIIRQFEGRARRRLAVVGHGQLQHPNHPTACPGVGVVDQIAAGLLDPAAGQRSPVESSGAVVAAAMRTPVAGPARTLTTTSTTPAAATTSASTTSSTSTSTSTSTRTSTSTSTTRSTTPTSPSSTATASSTATSAPTTTSTPRPTSTGDTSMSIKILRSLSNPPEFFAQFVAECDAQGHSIEVQWTGSGDDPRVRQRLADLKSAGIAEQHISLAGLRNNRLHPKHQPGQITDALRTWGDDDFAP